MHTERFMKTRLFFLCILCLLILSFETRAQTLRLYPCKARDEHYKFIGESSKYTVYANTYNSSWLNVAKENPEDNFLLNTDLSRGQSCFSILIRDSIYLVDVNSYHPDNGQSGIYISKYNVNNGEPLGHSFYYKQGVSQYNVSYYSDSTGIFLFDGNQLLLGVNTALVNRTRWVDASAMHLQWRRRRPMKYSFRNWGNEIEEREVYTLSFDYADLGNTTYPRKIENVFVNFNYHQDSFKHPIVLAPHLKIKHAELCRMGKKIIVFGLYEGEGSPGTVPSSGMFTQVFDDSLQPVRSIRYFSYEHLGGSELNKKAIASSIRNNYYGESTVFREALVNDNIAYFRFSTGTQTRAIVCDSSGELRLPSQDLPWNWSRRMKLVQGPGNLLFVFFKSSRDELNQSPQVINLSQEDVQKYLACYVYDVREDTLSAIFPVMFVGSQHWNYGLTDPEALRSDSRRELMLELSKRRDEWCILRLEAP